MNGTITIDRGQWNTGRAQEILNDYGLVCNGLKCVQAFYAEQALTGVTAERMTGYGSLEGLLGEAPQWMTQTVHHPGTGKNETVADALIAVNDNQKLHPTRREARVKLLFEHYGGFDVKFVGRYADAIRTATRVAGMNPTKAL